MNPIPARIPRVQDCRKLSGRGFVCRKYSKIVRNSMGKNKSFKCSQVEYKIFTKNDIRLDMNMVQ